MIEDLFTLPSARRKGLATAMIAAFSDRLRFRRCHTIFLGALASEHPKHLYARLGFQPLGLARTWVIKKVEDEPGPVRTNCRTERDESGGERGSLRIYLARHGETELNRQGLLQGRRDSALTPEGVAHAESLGAWLASAHEAYRPLTVWSSPLGRALRTAEIALSKARLDLPVRIDERLIEIDGGSLEGLSRSEVIEMTNGAPESDVLLLRSADGERYQDVSRRLSAWLSERVKEGGNHLVIGHAGSGRVLRAVYAASGPESLAAMNFTHSAIFKLEHGAVTEI